MEILLKRLPFLNILPILFMMAIGLTACFDTPTPSPTPIKSSQDVAQSNHDTVWTVASSHLKPVTDSSELENQVERMNRTNDPYHIWYMYIFSMDGKLIFYHQIRGKVSSTDSSAVNQWQLSCSAYGSNGGGSCASIDNPQLDGSYGMNEPGVFAFLNDVAGKGTMITTNFFYLIFDRYIPVTQQPVLNLNDNAGRLP